MLVLKCPRILRLVIVQAHDSAGIKYEFTSDLSLDSLVCHSGLRAGISLHGSTLIFQ